MAVGGVLLTTYTYEQLFRFVNSRNNAFLNPFMRSVTELGDGAGISIIILLVVLIFKGFRTSWFVFAAIVCNVVPALLIQMVKFIVHAPRPLQVFEHQDWVHILDSWPKLYDRSFPSGHTAGAFSLFCFLSLLLPKKYAPFGLLMFAVALLVGYSRMYLAAHFFRDVYVGSLIGTVATLALYRLVRDLHGRFFDNKDRSKTAAKVS